VFDVRTEGEVDPLIYVDGGYTRLERGERLT
jgi:hypothetical protein